MINRRSFVQGAASVAGILTLGTNVLAQSQAPRPSLPGTALFNKDEDGYWREVRKQFIIPDDVIHLNTGTVGSCPLPVLDAVFEGYRQTEKLTDTEPEVYPVWGYDEDCCDQFRDPMAALVGASRDEIALIHSATEGCNFMANGVDMKAGEEVIITDQEHSAGKGPWYMRAKRYGIVVKEVTIPQPLRNPADLLNLINDAITPRTRVIFASHISYVSGTILPVREICALARSKGIISEIDGAQVTGMTKVDAREIGCDLYTGSPHKWLMAPKGTGYLYVRDEMIDRMWNTITNGGWVMKPLRAARFQQFGTGNMPCLWGLRAAIQFAQKLGFDRIEKRTRQLADYTYAELLRRGVRPLTPEDPSMRCGIVAVNVPSIKRMELETWLWKQHKIRIRGGEPSRLRISTAYFVQKHEIDRFLEKFDQYMKSVA
jgi:selenocysteine lyase/cysteine desulfurase